MRIEEIRSFPVPPRPFGVSPVSEATAIKSLNAGISSAGSHPPETFRSKFKDALASSFLQDGSETSASEMYRELQLMSDSRGIFADKPAVSLIRSSQAIKAYRRLPAASTINEVA